MQGKCEETSKEEGVGVEENAPRVQGRSFGG
jgi:hypothetical protein